MPNSKRLLINTTTAATVYAIVRRDSDGYRLNDSGGAFASAPADPYVSLTEDAVIKGMYERSENRTAWSDGRYTVAYYKQAGGAPAPVSDTLLSVQAYSVLGDLEVNTYGTAADTTYIKAGVVRSRTSLEEILARIAESKKTIDAMGNTMAALEKAQRR